MMAGDTSSLGTVKYFFFTFIFIIKTSSYFRGSRIIAQAFANLFLVNARWISAIVVTLELVSQSKRLWICF